MTENRFEGKVAFVTGAGSGIGRATAIAFAREGADVVLADVDVAGLEETAQLAGSRGGRVIDVKCNITSEDDVISAIGRTVREFGRLDAAFNNAGVEQPLAALADISERDWTRQIEVNLRGAFLCMKSQIPAMLAHGGGGSIVNTSSAAGVVGFRGQAAYVAAKHGIIGLTKAAALDYAAQGIRVSAVCPGIIETPMMDRFSGGTPEGRARVIGQEPVGRMGSVEEIASAVLWLASDLGAFATGHPFIVDGGQTVGI